MRGSARQGISSPTSGPQSPAAVPAASRAPRLPSPFVPGIAAAQPANVPRITNVLSPASVRNSPQALPPTSERQRGGVKEASLLPHQRSPKKAHPWRLMPPSGTGGQIAPPSLDAPLYYTANERIEVYSLIEPAADKRERGFFVGIFPDDEDGATRRYSVCLVTCTAVVCMVLLLVDSTASAYFQHCDNPVSCFDLDTELRHSRLVDVDPCSNMFDHVCGLWTSMYPHQKDQFELLESRLNMVLLENIERASTGSESATDKAGAALFACMKVGEDEVDDISTIREVVHRHGLNLPAQQIRSSRDVFRILVGLTLQDLLGVFFQLKPSPYLQTDDRFVLELRYAETMYKYVSNEEAVEFCVRSYDPELEDVESLAVALTKVENDVRVVSMLYPFSGPEERYLMFEEIEKTYSDFAHLVPVIKTQWWVEDINENVPKQMVISPNSEILLRDKHALLITEALLRAYSTRSLPFQSYIAWKVIKYLSNAASSKMFHCHLSARQAHWTQTLAFEFHRCVTHVQVVIPYGLLSLRLKNILRDETVNYTLTVTKNIKQQIEKSYNSSLSDPQSSKSIVRRLRSVHQVIGTASKLRNTEALNSYYSHVPKYDAKQTFVKWLVKAHSATVAHTKGFLQPTPDIAASINRDDWEPTTVSAGAFYIILYHLVYLPGTILMSPLLVPHAPNSYNYGAIGKVIGHELSHALEPRFLEVRTRRDTQAFYAYPYKRLVEGQQECLILQANKMTESAIAGNNSISEMFADNAGVEVAYLAYSSLPPSERQEGVGPYTADQAFFAGSCYMFCEAEQVFSEMSIYLPHSVRCNQPCVNTQQFADAYHCKEDSTMFSGSRCDIHDLGEISHSNAY